jgi:GAF domain-containing protein
MSHHPPPLGAFIPVLAWPGRRPTLAELGTWHEALRSAVGGLLPVDLMACWLYPSRGGSVLIGPWELSADRLEPPVAEPLVANEALYALEDRIVAAGYPSVMAVPVRSEVRDVGLLLVASFEEGAYSRDSLRTINRVAAELATGCRRLASQPWIVPHPAGDDHSSVVSGVAEGLLDAMDGARDGSDLILLSSDALYNQLPHDRLELVAVAPAPECWALLSGDRIASRNYVLDPDATDAIDGLVHRFGGSEVVRLADLRAMATPFPASTDRRGAERMRSVLAARLQVGEELVGWLCLGSETPGWFRDEDEAVARLAARLLSARVAAWTARAELAGAWG